MKKKIVTSKKPERGSKSRPTAEEVGTMSYKDGTVKEIKHLGKVLPHKSEPRA